MKWISVNDKLPEDCITKDFKNKTIKVLVAIKAKNGITIRTQKRFLDYTYNNDGQKEWHWSWRYSAGEVTHWMPLPKLPEGE